jgi:hypothetical protein
MNKGEFLSPDSIANTVTLKGQEGMALFGPDGAYGALVITTKKYIREKTIMLKEVLVTNTYCSKICRYSTICGFSIPGDSLSAKQPSISRRANDPVYSNLPAVNIFPNPAAVDAPVTISFNGAATGEYQVSITNMSGQLVKQDVINISGKTFSYHIMPNAAMISGTCLINIINTTGKIIYSGQLVIQ